MSSRWDEKEITEVSFPGEINLQQRKRKKLPMTNSVRVELKKPSIENKLERSNETVNVYSVKVPA